MVNMKCDFCGKEIEFENINEVLQLDLNRDANYYVVCTKCAEKINNLVYGGYQVVQINPEAD